MGFLFTYTFEMTQSGQMRGQIHSDPLEGSQTMLCTQQLPQKQWNTDLMICIKQPLKDNWLPQQSYELILEDYIK